MCPSVQGGEQLPPRPPRPEERKRSWCVCVCVCVRAMFWRSLQGLVQRETKEHTPCFLFVEVIPFHLDLKECQQEHIRALVHMHHTVIIDIL